MKKRNPILVFLFGFITIFIYMLYWAVKTKGEMNSKGAKIPTAWILIIPIIGPIWWMWLYSKGVELVTENKLSGPVAFLLFYFLGSIGAAIIQDYFNKVGVSSIDKSQTVVSSAGSAPSSPNATTAQTFRPGQPSTNAGVIQPSSQPSVIKPTDTKT